MVVVKKSTTTPEFARMAQARAFSTRSVLGHELVRGGLYKLVKNNR
jgi:hypothetical protein